MWFSVPMRIGHVPPREENRYLLDQREKERGLTPREVLVAGLAACFFERSNSDNVSVTNVANVACFEREQRLCSA